MAKMIVVNEQRCLGCKTCVLECAMAHTEAKNLVEAIAVRHAARSRGCTSSRAGSSASPSSAATARTPPA